MAGKIVQGLATYPDLFSTGQASYGRTPPYTEYADDLEVCFDTLRITVNTMIDEIKAVQGPNATLGVDLLVFNDYVEHTPDPIVNGHIGIHSYQYTNNGSDIDIDRGDYLLNGQKVTLAASVNLVPSVATNPQYVALDANGYPILAVTAASQQVDIYQLTIAAGPTITAVTRLTEIFFDGDEYEGMRDRPAIGGIPATFPALNFEQFHYRMEAVEAMLAGLTTDPQGTAVGQPAIKAGDATTPGLAIVGATNTGIYGTTTTWSITTAGTNRFTISATSLAVAPPLYPNGGIVLDDDATPAGSIQFGEGQDAEIYYDGTDLKLVADLQNPSDFTVDCGTDKTLELVETVWDDLRVALSAGKTGATNPPNFEAFIDTVNAWAFGNEAINEEQMWFEAQLPHRYKEGTDIEAHIHWSPKAGGGAGEFVKWGLEYTWANVDGTFPSTTTITSDASTAGTATTSGDASLTADKHYITKLGTISGSGKTVSSMLVCRVFRNSSHADDDYTDDAFGLEIDFHFEVDTMGSRQEYIK